MSEKKRIVASIFSGAGGFDWGFHQANFETRLAVELKESPAKTIAHNLKLNILHTPITPTLQNLPAVVQGNIRDVDFSSLSSLQPDVVIGGPPCQDFSISKGSKREGLNGGRGKLYLEFLRTLMFLQPKMFVFENVPGFMSANDGQAYQTVLDDLRNLNAHRQQAIDAAQPVILPQNNIQDYVILFNAVVDAPVIGVPQTRRRLIIIGIRKDLALSSEHIEELSKKITSTLMGFSWNFSKYPLTPIEIFEGQPLHKLQDKYKQVMEAYRSLALDNLFKKTHHWRNNVWDKLTFDIVKDYYAANGLNYEKEHDITAFNTAMQQHKQLLKELNWLGKPVYQLSDISNNQTKHTKIVKARMLHIPPAENAEFVEGTEWHVESKKLSFIYRRSSPIKPAWTVMAYGGGGTYGYHYERQRQALTLRERARIQTFSDNFDFIGPEIRAQIGEAVPPLLGKRIANEIKCILDTIDDNLERPIELGTQSHIN